MNSGGYMLIERLISLESTAAADFINIMRESFNNLTQHHFIAKSLEDLNRLNDSVQGHHS